MRMSVPTHCSTSCTTRGRPGGSKESVAPPADGIPDSGFDALHQRADVNEDGVVDAFDMQIIANYWLQSYQPGQ